MKNNIRNLRERRGITQAEVCEKTGINVNSLSNMENGTQPINQHHALALADFFRCSIDFLFAREFQQPEKVSQPQAITPETVIPELRKWNLNQLAKMSGAMELEVSNRVYAKNEEESRKIESQNGGLFGSINTDRTVKK